MLEIYVCIVHVKVIWHDKSGIAVQNMRNIGHGRVVRDVKSEVGVTFKKTCKKNSTLCLMSI